MSHDNGLAINDLPGVKWWMRRRKKHYLRNFVMVTLFVGIFAFAFSALNFTTLKFSEMALLIFMGLFVVAFDLYLLTKWIQSFHCEIEEYWFGTIVDMRSYHKPGKKKRTYFISADVNGKILEGSCLLRTYRKAEKGQKILLFTLSGDRVFCVHPEM